MIGGSNRSDYQLEPQNNAQVVSESEDPQPVALPDDVLVTLLMAQRMTIATSQ
jgi:hypothetical protein